MPLVRITLRKGRTPQFIRSVGDAIHEALIAQVKMNPEERFHVIEEVEAANLDVSPTFGGVNRSDNVILVQITLNAGRTLDIKKALYKDIVDRLAVIYVRPDDVIVNLVEVTKENWSFGNGIATLAVAP